MIQNYFQSSHVFVIKVNSISTAQLLNKAVSILKLPYYFDLTFSVFNKISLNTLFIFIQQSDLKFVKQNLSDNSNCFISCNSI